MSIVEFVYSFYNPMRPKCRNCKHWKGDNTAFYNHCEIKNTEKRHNLPACIKFIYEDKLEQD